MTPNYTCSYCGSRSSWTEESRQTDVDQVCLCPTDHRGETETLTYSVDPSAEDVGTFVEPEDSEPWVAPDVIL
jgi:hypothetical protein